MSLLNGWHNIMADNIFYVKGEMNFSTAENVLRASLAFLSQQSEWKCDFSSVTACDSAGLALLIEWIKLAQQKNKPLQLLHLPIQLTSMAAASGLDSLLLLYK